MDIVSYCMVHSNVFKGPKQTCRVSNVWSYVHTLKKYVSVMLFWKGMTLKSHYAEVYYYLLGYFGWNLYNKFS